MPSPKLWIVLGVGILVSLLFGFYNDIRAYFILDHHDVLQGAEGASVSSVLLHVTPPPAPAQTPLETVSSSRLPLFDEDDTSQREVSQREVSDIPVEGQSVEEEIVEKEENGYSKFEGNPKFDAGFQRVKREFLEELEAVNHDVASERAPEKQMPHPGTVSPAPKSASEVPTSAGAGMALSTPQPAAVPVKWGPFSADKPVPKLDANGALLDDGIRYGRFDEDTLDDETFNQALRRGALKELPVVLVVTSYAWPPAFPLDWIKRQPWPAFVSTKVAGKGIHSEPWGNVGQEDATYFHFITKFYDDLPERMVFLHGHNKAWHQEAYLMDYLLRNACFDEHEYMSMNAFPATRSPKGNQKSSNEWKIIKKYWKPLGQGRLGPLPTNGMREKCCAQFMVHRTRVLRHPKSFYELQRNEMTDPKKSYKREMKKMGVHVGFDLVLFYESIWHVMWGEKPWLDDSKYGVCIDKDIERIAPTIKNKVPTRCMQKVIHCPQPLCQESPTCSQALEEAKTARGKG